MVLFLGPSSITSEPVGEIHLPSDVPPPLLTSATLPLTFFNAAWIIDKNSVFVVKYGCAFNVHSISNSHLDFSKTSTNLFLRDSSVDSGENLKLKSILRLPGTTFVVLCQLRYWKFEKRLDQRIRSLRPI